MILARFVDDDDLCLSDFLLDLVCVTITSRLLVIGLEGCEYEPVRVSFFPKSGEWWTLLSLLARMEGDFGDMFERVVDVDFDDASPGSMVCLWGDSRMVPREGADGIVAFLSGVSGSVIVRGSRYFSSGDVDDELARGSMDGAC